MKKIVGIALSMLVTAGFATAQVKSLSSASPFTVKMQAEKERVINEPKKIKAAKAHGLNPDLPAAVTLFSKNPQDRQGALKLSEIRPLDSKENARITLEVFVGWVDETGYQLLLDPSATAYGDIIPATGNLWTDGEGDTLENIYAAFEYIIPENATSVIDDYLVVTNNESLSIDIPAGTYDAVVVHPVPEIGWDNAYVGIAPGKDSRLDDYAFEAGREYVFSVVPLGYEDSVALNLKAEYDLAVTAITEPVSGFGLTGSENVTVAVENRGSKEVPSYSLSYILDNGVPVTEQVSEALAPGAARNYTFSTKADLSQENQTYHLKAYVTCPDDEASGNDTAQAEITHTGALLPPFACDFEDESDMELWTILDANEDGVTWYWSPYDYAAAIDYDFANPLDDYLVTLRPIALEEGSAYISFEYWAGLTDYVENLAVLYGKSSNPDSMQVIAEFESIATGTQTIPVRKNIEIEETGNYFFAFYAYSEPNMYGLYIDNVEIGQGALANQPDLAIEELLLPVSACGLSDQTPLRMLVSNYGQADILNYSVTYVLDSNPPVTEEFGGLKTGTDSIITFAQAMDLSEIGNHVIRVEARTLDPLADEDSTNNVRSGSVSNLAPIEPPFITDFSKPEQAANWTGNWSWNYDIGGYVAAYAETLLSRCIALEEGRNYRFSMDFLAGYTYMGRPYPEEFTVLFGPTGTDISTWGTLWYHQAYAPTVTSGDASFLCPATGNYSFAIVCNGYLYIREIAIAEVADYDVRINACRMPLARLVPAEQVNTEIVAEVELQNRGALTADVEVKVFQGGEELGSTTATLPGTDQVTTAKVPFALSGYGVGDEIVLTFQAEIPGHADADTSQDNTLSKTINVTRDEMAYDYVTDEMFAESDLYAIGSDQYELGAGIPFTLSVADTLTGISIGWGSPEGQEVTLAIHRWDAATQTLGDQLYEGTVSAGSSTGFARYEIPGLLLEAGDYMISESSLGYILMVDMTAEGFLYVTSTEPPTRQTGLGYPAIRAIFGSDAAVTATDAAIEGIAKPERDGIFTANQEVEVRVRNMGYEEIAVPVVLMVNKEEPLGPQTITLAPYASGSVTFTADMSVPGTDYLLTAMAQLEGDENPANDTASKLVRSFDSSNPYEMNFEFCQDWTTEGFNPKWTSVDGDGGQIGGWENVTFPLAHQPAGFFVFNPATTEPSLLESTPENATPHSGDRFGASMYVLDGTTANNDYLISPKLMLPASDAKMSFYVKSFIEDYIERYNVLVSETDNETSSFVQIGQTRQAPAAWTHVEVDLSEYAGKEVHVAIQCVSSNMFMFMIDDIVISRPAGNEGGDRLQAQLSLYPNPASETIRILSTDARINQVSILSLSGSVMFESASGMNQTEFRYNVSNLNSGLYFARVKTDQGTAVLKFLVR